MLPFTRVSVIGLGLIGSSVARAVRAEMPTVRLTGHDADPAVRAAAERLELCDDVTDTAGAAVTDADLVILCVPVGAMGAVAADIARALGADYEVLGLVQKLLGAGVLGTAALASGAVGGWLSRHPGFVAWQERFTGVVMVALGVRLALAGDAPRPARA